MKIDITETILLGLTLGEVFGKNISTSENDNQILSQPFNLSENTVDVIRWSKSLTSSSHPVISDFQNLSKAALIGAMLHQNNNNLDHIVTELRTIKIDDQNDILAGIATSFLVKMALDGIPTQDYFPRVWAYCSGIREDFDMTFRKIGHVLGWGSDVHALRHLGEGQTSQEIVTQALYCVMKYPDDYMAAFWCASQARENRDTIAALTGAIMVACLGFDALPKKWIEIAKLENIF